jgi:hypothetical protein
MTQGVDFRFLSNCCHVYLPGPARAVLTCAVMSAN